MSNIDINKDNNNSNRKQQLNNEEESPPSIDCIPIDRQITPTSDTSQKFVSEKIDSSSENTQQSNDCYVTTNAQEKYSPPVPLKTYKWEDIRRAKEQGRYPWTYLKYTDLSNSDSSIHIDMSDNTDKSLSVEDISSNITEISEEILKNEDKENPGDVKSVEIESGKVSKIPEPEVIEVEIKNEEPKLEDKPKVEEPKIMETEDKPKVEEPKLTEAEDKPKVEGKNVIETEDRPKVEELRVIETEDKPKIEKSKVIETEDKPKVQEPEVIEPDKKTEVILEPILENNENIEQSKESTPEKKPEIILEPIEYKIQEPNKNIEPRTIRTNSITHIIIPIDHTIQAQMNDDHIYEPIERPEVEIHINDIPVQRSLDENDVPTNENDVEMPQKLKPPPLSKMLMENQSMSVDEERSYLDKKILKATSLEEDYNKWSTLNDHEYEIINAPAEESRANEVLKTGPPLAREVEMEDIDDASSISSAERRFLRVPLDTEIIVPEDGQSEDAAMSDEGIGDDRCVSATPTTNDSRTDCELNTSQVDSSALEVLPLQRESRKQATLATEEVVNHPNIGQRMKSSASRIKTKLQNIRKTREATTDRPLKKTKIVKVKVERPKSERPSLLDRARKIERPKFSMPKMPDRPKFNMPKMPDMPKMPERPKINMPKMPDRPKMKMPDISMPKMPDISMPKMPDISMPKMPDFSSLGRKPKETTAAPVITSTITTTSESKKTTSTSDSPDDDAPKKKRFDFEFRHPKKTTSTSDSADDDAPKKKRFDFDFRTYPKILNRTKKQKTVVMAPLSTSTDQSVQSDDKPKSTFFTEYIPDWVTMPRKARKKVPVGQRWANKFSDIKFADDESLRSGKSKENVYVQEYPPPTPAPVIFNSNDPLVQYIPLKDPNKTLSDEEEEYEEDLGQENINTTNILYTTEQDIQPQIQEISPEKQEISPEILIKPPIVEEEIISEPELSPSPEVPEPKNTFAIIGTTNSGESLQPDSHREDRSYASSERGGVIEEINSDEFFVREKGLSQDNIDVSLYLSSEIREAFQNPVNALSQMIENGVHPEDFVEYDRRLQEDYTKMRDQSPIFEPAQTPPTKTLRKKKKQSICSQEVSTISTDNIPERKIDQSDDNFKTYPPSRPSRSRKGSVASKKHDSQGISQNDLDLENNVIPQIPFRRKRSLRSAKSLNISEHFNDSLLRSDQNVSLQEIRSNNYAIEESPPVPKRRARSSHSRSTIHTINDDDRTSRGADSLISEDRNDTQNSISAPIRNYTPPGYAKVEKIKDNSNVPPAQPPPRTKRKKQIKETQFFTVPRRLKDEDTPQRPLRNYSTLRSSRKNSSSRQSTPAHDKENQIQDDEYIEIDDEEASHKKLQSGEVIQKMKSRPLPAPPRPPRKTTRHPNDGILKEIHIDNIEDANLLTSEDKTHSAKISNESIIKGTLLLDGNQINIDVHPISLEVEAENLANRLKDLQTEIIPNNERHITPEITIVDNDGKVDIPEKLDEGTEKQDISEKRLSNLSDSTTTPLVLGQFSIEEVEISTQTDPLPEDFVCEEVVAEPTDIIIIPTNRKNISEEITFVPVQEVPSTQRRTLLEQISFDPSEDGFTGSEMSPSIDISDNPLDRHLDEIKVPKRGILEQQSHERLSESPVEPCDETYLKESLVRLARSEQSSLISRPVGDHEITQKVEYHPPRESAPPSTNIALPETLRVQRLQVSDLDVDRLTVSELMAQKLLVSEIDGMSLKLNDITSQSGTISTDEIKLPPHLIEEILSRLQSSIQMSQPPPVPAPTVAPPEVVEKRITYYKEESTNTDDSLPPPSEDTKSMQSSISIETVTESTATPKAPSTVNEIVSQAVPYPHIYVLPPSFYQHMTQPSTSTTAPPPTNVPPAPAPDPEIETIPDPSIPNLSAQLLRACHSSASNSIRQVIIQITSYLNSGDEKQDARTAIIVLIVLLAALILLGFSSRTEPVHHHHWEYFNPPTGDRPI